MHTTKTRKEEIKKEGKENKKRGEEKKFKNQNQISIFNLKKSKNTKIEKSLL